MTVDSIELSDPSHCAGVQALCQTDERAMLQFISQLSTRLIMICIRVT